MGALATQANLGPAVRVGNEQVRISTARTGGKWRALLEMLLRKAEGDAICAPLRIDAETRGPDLLRLREPAFAKRKLVAEIDQHYRSHDV